MVSRSCKTFVNRLRGLFLGLFMRFRDGWTPYASERNACPVAKAGCARFVHNAQTSNSLRVQHESQIVGPLHPQKNPRTDWTDSER